MFRPISSEIFESMTNLVDFYVIIVHSFFAHDQQVRGYLDLHSLSYLEVEQAQQFRAWVLSQDESEPAQMSLEPALSPSFLLIKTTKFKLEPASSFSEN